MNFSSFRSSAAAMRSRKGFDGTFVTFDHETGEWRAGINRTGITGRQLVAAVYDLFVVWQRFFAGDRKFHYASAGFVRDGHQPPARDRLPDRNPDHWEKPDRDPWQLVWYLALFDQETREQFLYSSGSDGGRQTLAALQEAFADHNEGRGSLEWPIVELSSDSYVNKKTGMKVYKPLLEILNWVTPPAAFRRPKLPEADIKIYFDVPEVDELDFAGVPEGYPDFDPEEV